jgi:hypothetical protein
MQPQEAADALVLAAKWVALPVFPASGNLTADGDDLRVSVQPFPPPLMPPPFTSFEAFSCRHGCPLPALSEVFIPAMLGMAACQPSLFLTA